MPHDLEDKAHVVLQQLWLGHRLTAKKVAAPAPAGRSRRRRAKAKEFPDLVPPVFEDSDEY